MKLSIFNFTGYYRYFFFTNWYATPMTILNWYWDLGTMGGGCKSLPPTKKNSAHKVNFGTILNGEWGVAAAKIWTERLDKLQVCRSPLLWVLLLSDSIWNQNIAGPPIDWINTPQKTFYNKKNLCLELHFKFIFFIRAASHRRRSKK